MKIIRRKSRASTHTGFNDTWTNPSATILNMMFVFLTKCFVRHHFKFKPLRLLLAPVKRLYIRDKHMVELEH